MAKAAVLAAFPKALKNVDLIYSVSKALKKYGYGRDTLLCSSICCDELARELEHEFAVLYGSDFFRLGGLSAFPFAGITGFGAMASHIPEEGSCLIVFGPHVGVDSKGFVGKANRRGRHQSDACCDSANAAAAAVSKIYSGKMDYDDSAPPDLIDPQQGLVVSKLLPFAERLAEAENPAIELPYIQFETQKEMMDEILAAGTNTIPDESKIALLGGIQINTPHGLPDFFEPHVFELRDNKNTFLDNLLHKL